MVLMLKAVLLGLVFIWIGGGIEETLGHNAVTPALVGAGILVLIATTFLSAHND